MAVDDNTSESESTPADDTASRNKDLVGARPARYELSVPQQQIAAAIAVISGIAGLIGTFLPDTNAGGVAVLLTISAAFGYIAITRQQVERVDLGQDRSIDLALREAEQARESLTVIKELSGEIANQNLRLSRQWADAKPLVIEHVLHRTTLPLPIKPGPRSIRKYTRAVLAVMKESIPEANIRWRETITNQYTFVITNLEPQLAVSIDWSDPQWNSSRTLLTKPSLDADMVGLTVANASLKPEERVELETWQLGRPYKVTTFQRGPQFVASWSGDPDDFTLTETLSILARGYESHRERLRFESEVVTYLRDAGFPVQPVCAGIRMERSAWAITAEPKVVVVAAWVHPDDDWSPQDETWWQGTWSHAVVVTNGALFAPGSVPHGHTTYIRWETKKHDDFDQVLAAQVALAIADDDSRRYLEAVGKALSRAGLDPQPGANDSQWRLGDAINGVTAVALLDGGAEALSHHLWGERGRRFVAVTPTPLRPGSELQHIQGTADRRTGLSESLEFAVWRDAQDDARIFEAVQRQYDRQVRSPGQLEYCAEVVKALERVSNSSPSFVEAWLWAIGDPARGPLIGIAADEETLTLAAGALSKIAGPDRQTMVIVTSQIGTGHAGGIFCAVWDGPDDDEGLVDSLDVDGQG